MKHERRRIARLVRSASVLLILFAGAGNASAVEIPGEPLGRLASPEFRQRESAQSELLAWGRAQREPARLALLEASQSARDPEVRARCFNVLRDLINEQYMTEGDGYMGIRLKDELTEISAEPKPCHVLRVTEVVAGMPAAKAGIGMNDLIVSLDGHFWHDGDASPLFIDQVRSKKPGNTVVLGILRDGKILKLEVVLTRRPIYPEGLLQMGGNLMLSAPEPDSQGVERAAKEAYFRQWLAERKPPK